MKLVNVEVGAPYYRGFVMLEDSVDPQSIVGKKLDCMVDGEDPMFACGPIHVNGVIEGIVNPEEDVCSIAILNTTIATTDGEYRIKTIDQQRARYLIANRSIVSAIGHESTAHVASEVIGRTVEVNRINF